jgi:hypothetical protein
MSNSPLRILALDGGGMKALSSLYILRELFLTVQAQLRGIGDRGPWANA